MAHSDEGFTQYVSSLISSNGFSEAFQLFESEVYRIGFEGVLYTYIPSALIDMQFPVKPVYEVSKNYAPEYLSHYSEARFERYDPLIKAVKSGESKPINWWGELCKQHINNSSASAEVITVSQEYGINNGLTIPLLSGRRGIAGVSFITGEKSGFDRLLQDKLEELELYSNIFHRVVAADQQFSSRFSLPLLKNLSHTELQLLKGLADGQSMAEVSTAINRSLKYLEQVMLSLRRKISGVEEGMPPGINRNQLLYYAGLLNILEDQNLPSPVKRRKPN
ncbi:hypothetical protein AB833_31610 [Chromatiales bacterium (ex Bugula neritina AB1)]|nr:hypothetical protein AB833_31610 [Chromatiales bacterium (ex Bugula neritina AB1)]